MDRQEEYHAEQIVGLEQSQSHASLGRLWEAHVRMFGLLQPHTPVLGEWAR